MRMDGSVLGGWDGKSSRRVGGDEGAGVDTASSEEMGVACPG